MGGGETEKEVGEGGWASEESLKGAGGGVSPGVRWGNGGYDEVKGLE